MSEIKNSNTNEEDLPEEIRFDYSKAKPNRFAERLKDQQVMIALDSDVAAVFGNAATVNRVLRALIETMPPSPAEAV